MDNIEDEEANPMHMRADELPHKPKCKKLTKQIGSILKKYLHEIKELKKSLNEKEAIIHQNEANELKLKRQIDNANMKHAELKDQLADRANDIDKLKASIKNENDENARKIVAMQEKIDEGKDNESALLDKQKANNKLVKDLKHQIEAEKAKLAEQDDKFKYAMDKHANELEKIKRTNDEKIGDLEQSNNENLEKINGLKQSLKEAKASHNNECKALQQQIDAQAAKQKENDKQIADLIGKLDKMKRKMAEQAQANDDQSANDRALIKKLKYELAEYEHELAEYEHDIDGLKDSLEREKTAHDVIVKKVAELNEEMSVEDRSDDEHVKEDEEYIEHIMQEQIKF